MALMSRVPLSPTATPALGTSTTSTPSSRSLTSDGLANAKLSGINKPYLYIGGFGTMFAWHCEDLDLASINFMHSGAAKFWYFVPARDQKKLELYMKSKYPQAFVECPQYFRHKTIVVNPYLVKQYNPSIHLTKLQQNPGEFIIIFDSVYHHGFNLGFNMAEAVNFATPGWLPRFPRFNFCRCHKDNVRINPQYFCENLAAREIKSARVPKNARVY
jgi:jumonji domain-containing protein 2